MDTLRIRPLDPGAPAEIDLVAHRMRATLVEVLGAERGTAMYSLDWLRDRVCFHLDPARSTAAVLLAEVQGGILGHTIVRVERDERGEAYGLFSTTWVQPEGRRRGVAGRLLAEGEAWMRGQGLARAATWTARDNSPLQALYLARGYAIVTQAEEMVELAREL